MSDMKQSLFSLGGTALGGALFGPVGAQVGSMAGTALGGAMTKPETPEVGYRMEHPELSPFASYSRGEQARPQRTRYFKDRQRSPFANTADMMQPLLSAAVPQIMDHAGFGGILGNNAGIPEAKQGMAIPSHAPTHEQGGVDIEVEGGELVLNQEQQAYINSGKTPEEQSQRYQQVVSTLKAKGMPSNMKAANGLYANVLAAMPDLNNLPSLTSTPTGAAHNSYPVTPGAAHNSPAYNGRYSTPFMRDGNMPGINSYQQNAPTYLSLTGDTSQTQNQVEPEQDLNPYEKAARDIGRLGRFSTGSDLAKSLIHGRSLFSDQMISSPAFRSDPVQSPTYQDASHTMMGDIDSSLAQMISLSNALPPQQRIAMLSEGMTGAMEGRRDVARHASEIANMNEQARAQTANMESERKLGMDQMNYQKMMQENQMEHARKNAALGGLFQSTDAAIKKRGDSLMDQSTMNILGQLQRDMEPSDFQSIMQTILGQQLR